MLNKYNLQIAKVTSNDEDRAGLCHVKVEKYKTIATNGRILIEVTRPKVDWQEYPQTGHELKQDKTFYINKQDAQNAIKSIPKKVTLPILTNVAVSQHNGDTSLITTDCYSTNVLRVKNAPDINYPKTRHLYNTLPKETVRIKLDPKLLKLVAEQVSSFSEEVYLDVSEPNQPIKFMAKNKGTGQVMRGLLMPICQD